MDSGPEGGPCALGAEKLRQHHLVRAGSRETHSEEGRLAKGQWDSGVQAGALGWTGRAGFGQGQSAVGPRLGRASLFGCWPSHSLVTLPSARPWVARAPGRQWSLWARLVAEGQRGRKMEPGDPVSTSPGR